MGFEERRENLRVSGRSEGQLGEAFFRGKIMGKMCTRGKRAEAGQFLGTVSVARDVLIITDASWDLSKPGTREGLQYWGLSYGLSESLLQRCSQFSMELL